MNKTQKKLLRELRNIAYTRELNYHLGELKKKFDEWQNNIIDCGELNDIIHQFHDGTSRDLYKLYNYTSDDSLLISRAVSLGFLEQSEVPEDVNVKLFFGKT